MSRSITPLCMDTGYKTLREYLDASRLTEVEVPQDGLCILHAVHGGLQSSHTSTGAQGLSKEKVKDMVRDEFLQHGEEYMPYSALSEEDTLAQLECWAQTGQYGSDSVDLILHILSQVLNLRVIVVEETISRVTSLELLPHRQEKCSFIPTITSVILIKHDQHFNHTVFSLPKEHRPFKKEITYTDTTEPIIISSDDSDDEWYLAGEGPNSRTKVCRESPINCQSTDVPTMMQQSEAAYQRTDVPTTMQQSQEAYQRTDVPTTMQQSEAACQRTDVPTTMQQSETAYQRTDVPTTMQQSEAACHRTDVPTTMQQSEEACQTDVPTTMQQEARVPAPSAATGTVASIGNIGTVSGIQSPTVVAAGQVIFQYNSPPDAAAAPGQGDITTSSQNAKSTSPSPSPIPSAQASGSPQQTRAIGNIGTISGNNNPTIVGSRAVNLTYNSPSETESTYSSQLTRASIIGNISINDGNNINIINGSSNVKIQSPAREVSPQRTGAFIENFSAVTISNKPVIVHPIADTCNNFPMEGPGEHAPRTRCSQRPDQEPRAEDPFQEAGDKTGDILKRVDKTTRSNYVQLLDITGIFTKVQLERREGLAVVSRPKGETDTNSGQKGEIVESAEYAKMFTLTTGTEKLTKHLIFFGMDLVDTTFDQLLGEKSGIAKDELDEIILTNSNEVLIRVDGFDKMRTKTLDADSFDSIVKALNDTIRYKDCLIWVSSTCPSETPMSDSLVQNPCPHVKVPGFTDEDVQENILRFYDKDPDSGKALIQTIQKSNMQRALASNPMLLLLMCLLWRQNKQLPEITSLLFNKAVDHMFTGKHLSGEDLIKVSKTVFAIRNTVLLGLGCANQKVSFQEDESKPKAPDQALKAGILTKKRVIKNPKSDNIQIQKYCIVTFLQRLNISTHGLPLRVKSKL